MNEVDIMGLFENEDAPEGETPAEADTAGTPPETEEETPEETNTPAAVAGTSPLPPEIVEMLTQNNRAMQAQAEEAQRSREFLTQMLPRQETMTAEEKETATFLDPYIRPLKERNEQLARQVEQLMREREAVREEAFRDAQLNAIQAVKTKFPDFDPKVAWSYMQQDIEKMVQMGATPEQAENIALHTYGTSPSALERIWKAHIYQSPAAQGARLKPDEHISASASPVSKKSFKEALASGSQTAKNSAILELFG